MNPPIERISGTNPPRFRWRQKLSTPFGDRVIDHEGMLAPTVEGALVEMIELVRRQAQEIVGLHRVNGELTDRVAALEAAESVDAPPKHLLEEPDSAEKPAVIRQGIVQVGKRRG